MNSDDQGLIFIATPAVPRKASETFKATDPKWSSKANDAKSTIKSSDQKVSRHSAIRLPQSQPVVKLLTHDELLSSSSNAVESEQISPHILAGVRSTRSTSSCPLSIPLPSSIWDWLAMGGCYDFMVSDMSA